MAIWSAVEVNLGLLCASAPAARPLIRKIAPTLLRSTSETTDSSSADSQSKKRNTSNCDPMSCLGVDDENVFKSESHSDIEDLKNKHECTHANGFERQD